MVQPPESIGRGGHNIPVVVLQGYTSNRKNTDKGKYTKN